MNRILVFLLILLIFGSCRSTKDHLIRFEDADYNCGYLNTKGDTIVPAGKYSMCFSDTIAGIGFVIDTAKGIVCIDNSGKYLFRVFNYDNGPDYASEGLFRIVNDGKIGYANMKGKIVIEAQYKCAWPFENGVAQVSYNCNIVRDGELDLWKEGDWFYIDKKGRVRK